MAFVDNAYKKGEQEGSSTPLAQGQGQQAPAPATNQADSNVAASAPGSQTGQQTNTASKTTNKKGPASSGMFTNIQNYVNKNKEHSKKMSDDSLGKIKESADRLKEEKAQALSQFTDRSNQDGLTDTDARLNEFNQYVNTEANQDFAGPQQADTTGSMPVKNEAGETIGYRDVQTGTVTDVDPESPEQKMAKKDALLQKNNFERIINAEYGGPKSLLETGDIYNRLSGQAKRSSKLGQLAQTTEGRGNLLKELFNKEGYGYTRGQNELDKLLMGNQVDTVKEMQRAGQDIGTYDNILKQAGSEAGSIADIASGKVDELRDASRESFKNIATERQEQVDNRINDVITNWDKLPAYFRDIMSNPDGSVNMSAVEASILGVGQGEGFYNLTGDEVFGTKDDPAVQAQRNQLISKKEQSNLARLNSLSNLANTNSKLYNIRTAGETDFSDASKAGTQSASDALDLQRVRTKMAEAEQKFRDDASIEQKGWGEDYERYAPGGGKAGEKEWAESTMTGSVKEALGNSGYDFDSEIAQTSMGNKDILKQLSTSANKVNPGQNYIDSQFGSSVGNVIDGGLDVLGGNFGSTLDGLKLDYNDIATLGMLDFGSNALTEVLGDNNMFSTGLDNIGNAINDAGEDIFGGSKHAARKIAQAGADQKAAADLKQKLDTQFAGMNFDRRSSVGDTAETKAREEALYQLMRGLDTTNQ